MSEQAKEQTLLLKEVTKQLVVLEEAIANINLTRKQLKQQSAEMKSEIQTTVTRKLETLRQHEASLLKQVDLIQQAKDAALQGEEDKLHEALGSLTIALKIEEGLGESPIRDVLQRLKNLKISPTETLSFNSDIRHPSNVASRYGGLQFGGMFDSETSSTSLPKPFEDYGDDEHHVLYRSISESAGSCDRNISVMVPRLSQKPEDWLFMPAEDLTPAKPVVVPGQFLFPPFMSGSLKEHLEKHDDMSRVSIHQWLCDIQRQADVEEEEADFDVLSSSAFLVPTSSKDSSIEVLTADEATPMFTMGSLMTSTMSLNTAMKSLVSSTNEASQNTTFSYFDQVMSGPTTNWLLSTQDQEAPQTSAAYCQEVLRYFHEASSDTKMWLQQYAEKKQKETYSDVGESYARDPDVVKNFMMAAQGQDLCFDYDKWLISKKELDNTGVKSVAGMKGLANVGRECCQTIEHGSMCRASEGGMPVSHCVLVDDSCCARSGICSDRCCTAESKSALKLSGSGWLVGSYFDQILNQDVDRWLLAGNVVSSGEGTCGMKDSKQTFPFCFMPFSGDSGYDSCWLLETSESVVPSGSAELISLAAEERFNSDSEINESVDNQSLKSSHYSNSVDISNRVQPPDSDFLFTKKPNDSPLLDLSKWLLGGCCANTELLPKQAWLQRPDGCQRNVAGFSSADLDFPRYFDSFFECFKEAEEDNARWLLNTKPAVE